MKRHVTIALLALGLGVLSACDDGGGSERPPTNPLLQKNDSVDLNAELAEALKTKVKKGSRLVARPNIIFIEVAKGGTDEQTIRLSVEGDTPVKILSLALASRNPGLSLGGSCENASLDPGRTCDIILSFKDTTGRGFDTAVLVTSDAKETPQFSLQVTIDVLEERAAPAPKEPAPPSQPTAPTIDPRIAAQIQLMNEARRASGFGRLASGPGGFAGLPQTGIKTRDNHYAPDLFPSVETTLPVDRSRILTADRTIKAVLETPITNVMCQRAIAVVETPIYSPENRNVLVPAGTRFIGRCDKLVDERIALAWHRFITPDGVSARIKADSADAMGRGGVPGHLDRRYWDRFGLPLVFSAVKATFAGVVGGSDSRTVDLNSGIISESRSARAKAMDQFQKDTETIAEDFVEDFKDVRPIVTIPGGTRLDIVLNEDIYFKTPAEVVRLADVEYEVKRREATNIVEEAPPPGFGLAPTLGRPGDGAPTVTIDGRTYELVPAGTAAPRAAAPGTGSYGPAGVAVPGVSVNEGQPPPQDIFAPPPPPEGPRPPVARQNTYQYRDTDPYRAQNGETGYLVTPGYNAPPAQTVRPGSGLPAQTGKAQR